MSELASYIDHTLLKPDATRAQLEQLCAEAAEHQFSTVCVNGSRVELAYSLLEDSDVQVCTVVGFPLGAMDAAFASSKKASLASSALLSAVSSRMADVPSERLAFGDGALSAARAPRSRLGIVEGEAGSARSSGRPGRRPGAVRVTRTPRPASRSGRGVPSR